MGINVSLNRTSALGSSGRKMLIPPYLFVLSCQYVSMVIFTDCDRSTSGGDRRKISLLLFRALPLMRLSKGPAFSLPG